MSVPKVISKSFFKKEIKKDALGNITNKVFKK